MITLFKLNTKYTFIIANVVIYLVYRVKRAKSVKKNVNTITIIGYRKHYLILILYSLSTYKQDFAFYV